MVVFDRSRHLSSASARQTQIIGTLESTLDAVWLTAPSDRQPAGDGATLFSSGHANCAADAPVRQAPLAPRFGSGCGQLLDPSRTAWSRTGNDETTVLNESI